MLRLVHPYWTLTRLTVLEIIRQPFCLLVTLTSLLFIGLLPLVLTHTLGHAEKLVRDSALAIHLGGGLVLGGTAASAALREDLRRGAAAVILTKPIGRAIYFLAKYSGVCLVLIPLSLAATMATLLSARTVRDPYVLDLVSGLGLPAALAATMIPAGLANYVWRKPFASAGFWGCLGGLAGAFAWINTVGPDGHPAAFGSRLDLALIPVSILILLALLVFAALSVSLATRLDTPATLVGCGMVLLVGLMSDALFGRAASTSFPAAIGYGLLPNWQHFWAADALTSRTPVSWEYLRDASLYAASYAGAVLCLGLTSFRHREIRS
jgi:hypothetical protein